MNEDENGKHIDKELTIAQTEALKLVRNRHSERLRKLLQIAIERMHNYMKADPTNIDKGFVDIAQQVYEIALTVNVLNIENEELNLREISEHLDRVEKMFKDESDKKDP
jgi:RNA polymerase-binding transcription factor DksA